MLVTSPNGICCCHLQKKNHPTLSQVHVRAFRGKLQNFAVSKGRELFFSSMAFPWLCTQHALGIARVPSPAPALPCPQAPWGPLPVSSSAEQGAPQARLAMLMSSCQAEMCRGAAPQPPEPLLRRVGWEGNAPPCPFPSPPAQNLPDISTLIHRYPFLCFPPSFSYASATHRNVVSSILSCTPTAQSRLHLKQQLLTCSLLAEVTGLSRERTISYYSTSFREVRPFTVCMRRASLRKGFVLVELGFLSLRDLSPDREQRVSVSSSSCGSW